MITHDTSSTQSLPLGTIGTPLRVLFFFWAGEASSRFDDLEFEAILMDLNKLEAPDSEIDGKKKAVIAARMRQSYRCFNI